MLRLLLFDQFHAAWGSESSLSFPSYKAQALLAYLATERQSHTRIKLATLLWADASDGNARNSVRVTLYRLRRLLDNIRPNLGSTLIHTNRTTVTLSSELWCDVTDFQARWQQAQHTPTTLEPLQQAIDLYRGEFLAGFPGGISNNFDEWLQLTRQQLHTRAIQLFDQLLSQQLANRQYQQMIPIAQRQIGLEAWHEQGYLHLMLAHASLGQTPEALRVYEQCHAVLKKELDVEPTENLQNIADALRRGDWKSGQGSLQSHAIASRVVRHNLPQALPTFFAREQELATLEKVLNKEQQRWVTIVGPGGMGKSRLAMEAGRRLLPHFDDGVWFVELAGLQNSADSREQIAIAIADSINLSLGGTGSAEVQLTHYLYEANLLLILDNFEHLLDSAGLIYNLLNKTGKVTVLCTSREPLYYQAEQLLWLDGLATPHLSTEQQADIASFASIQLFLERANRLRLGLVLDEKTAPAIVNICSWLDGSPLGIELAATWTHELSVAQIWRTLQQSFNLLRTRMRDVPQRHRSLRTVLLHSWERLDDTGRNLLMALSVFRGSFSAEAVGRVCNATEDATLYLIDKSLLQLLENGRYRLHKVVRQFSAEQLSLVSTQHHAVQQKHSAYFLQFLAARQTALQADRPQEPAAEIDHDINNIRAAWHYAIETDDWKLIPNAVVPLSVYYQIRGLTSEGEQRYQQTLAHLLSSKANAPLLRPMLLAEQARFLVRLAKYKDVISLIHKAIAKGMIGQDEGSVKGLILLAEAHWRLGQLEKAKGVLEQARLVLDSAEFSYPVGSYHFHMGSVHMRLGHLDHAREHVQNALSHWTRLNQQRARATTLNLLGDIVLRQNSLDKAQMYQTEALSIHRSIVDRRGQAFDLNNLAVIDEGKGDFESAIAKLEKARKHAHQCSDTALDGLITHNLGWMYSNTNQHQRAIRFLKSALRLRQSINDQWGEVFTQAALGVSFQALNQLSAAQQGYDTASSLCSLFDYHPMAAFIEERRLQLASRLA